MNITRLLIANRGEIAVRIMKTAKRLGIHTIAVYSDADVGALHVKTADSSYFIGAAPSMESYLNIDNILQAAADSNADAIHPGYGFLAENPDFAARCKSNDIVFVGPPVDAINAMGLKGIAKQRMMDAAVPVLPGINKVIDADIEKQTAQIGYPVLIKPEAGGGGKGMKIVRKPGDLLDSIYSARREALSSFGNDALIVELYLDHPRHVEIQIFADEHGNCIHLNERDCSLQRRHQKVVEEAPAPNFSDELRQQMGKAAVNAALAINYVGAGTVEFLLSDEGEFYFMEMNTRLQVEHPVTEMITGEDLVEWQLNIASGEELPRTQNEIGINGHAIEVRLYAEDPINNFLPASGKIEYLKLPHGVRIDSGVFEGDSIGVFYDPMMMKIIAWGESREEAIQDLSKALGGVNIAGLKTNRDFLVSLLLDERFRSGTATTDYLDLQPPYPEPSAEDKHDALVITALYLIQKSMVSQPGQSPWSTESNYRFNQKNTRQLILFLDEQKCLVDTETSSDSVKITTEFGESVHGPQEELKVFHVHDRVTVFLPHRTIAVNLPGAASQKNSAQEKNVNAPMSGKIISVLVKTDAEVEEGTALAVIEAMKMEHTIYAPCNGTIKEIYFAENDLIEEGMELLDFSPSTLEQ